MRFGLCGPCEMPASFMVKFAMMIIISNLVRPNLVADDGIPLRINQPLIRGRCRNMEKSLLNP